MPALKIIGWVILGVVLFITLCNCVFPQIYEHYFGIFNRKSKLILHKKMELSYFRIYIVRIKSEFMPPPEHLDSFIAQTYRDMGLAHAEKADMEKLECCHGESGLGNMTVSSEIDPGVVKSIYFMPHTNRHEIRMSESLPRQDKYSLLAAIDVSRSARHSYDHSQVLIKAAA